MNKYKIDLIPKNNNLNRGILPLMFDCGNIRLRKNNLALQFNMKEMRHTLLLFVYFFKIFRTRCISRIKRFI